MAIAATWLVTATNITSSASIYTTPTTGYTRDLVITNDGPSKGYVSLSADATSASSTASFTIPSGGSVILTACAVPTNAVVYALASTGGTVSVSIGLASVVSYV